MRLISVFKTRLAFAFILAGSSSSMGAEGNYKDLLVDQSDFGLIQNYLRLSKRERLLAQGEYLKLRPALAALKVFEGALTRDGIAALKPVIEQRLEAPESYSKPLRFDSIFEGGIIYIKFENLPCESPKSKRVKGANLFWELIPGTVSNAQTAPSQTTESKTKNVWEKTWWDDTVEFICPSEYPLVEKYFCVEFLNWAKTNPTQKAVSALEGPAPKSSDVLVGPPKPPVDTPLEKTQAECPVRVRLSVGFSLRSENKKIKKSASASSKSTERVLFEGEATKFRESFSYPKLKVEIYRFLESRSGENAKFSTEEPWLLPLSEEKFNRQRALFIFLQAESIIPTENPGNICSLNQKILDRMKMRPDSESLKICQAENKSLQTVNDQAIKPLTRISLRRSSALSQLPPEAQAHHENLARHFEVILGFLHFSTSEGLNVREVQFFDRLQNGLEQNLASEIMGELWPFWRASLKSVRKDEGSDLEARIALNVVDKINRGERVRLVNESERIKILLDLSLEFQEILKARQIKFEKINPKNIPEPLTLALKDHQAWVQFVELVSAELLRRGL